MINNIHNYIALIKTKFRIIAAREMDSNHVTQQIWATRKRSINVVHTCSSMALIEARLL
jgi:hypothetical protein